MFKTIEDAQEFGLTMSQKLDEAQELALKFINGEAEIKSNGRILSIIDLTCEIENLDEYVDAVRAQINGNPRPMSVLIWTEAIRMAGGHLYGKTEGKNLANEYWEANR